MPETGGARQRRAQRNAARGRPGEDSLVRVLRAEARLWFVITTSNLEPLRRPLESAQYVSIRYTERLAEAGIEPSVGSVGDSYDNALAESIIGLFKTEVINFLGPWKSVSQVEWETLKWVDWYNTDRLHSAIGYVTPQEAEEAFYENLNAAGKAA